MSDLDYEVFKNKNTNEHIALFKRVNNDVWLATHLDEYARPDVRKSVFVITNTEIETNFEMCEGVVK